jgi:hypothetical protein
MYITYTAGALPSTAWSTNIPIIYYTQIVDITHPIGDHWALNKPQNLADWRSTYFWKKIISFSIVYS